MSRPPMGLSLEIPEQEEPPRGSQLGFRANEYSLTDSGTFTQGGLQINRNGIVLDGHRFTGGVNHTAGAGVVGGGLTVDAPPPVVTNSVPLGVVSDHVETLQSQIDFNDLDIQSVLGRGNSGTVYKVLHRPTSTILALKSIPLNLDDAERSQLVQELRILLNIRSEHCVSFYGGFLKEGSFMFLLEYMDFTVTDLLKRAGSLPEPILARLAYCMLHGLVYLHRTHHLIHRDIKPSNILINRRGEFKISDFGVSRTTQNSMQQCQSWVGTVTYMSPERITGDKYDHRSDIWSVGVTLLECGLGKFPFLQPDGTSGRNLGFWDVLDYVVSQPVPQLHPAEFSKEFRHFIHICLEKNIEQRPTAAQLLHHPFIVKHENDNIDFAMWLNQLFPNEELMN